MRPGAGRAPAASSGLMDRLTRDLREMVDKNLADRDRTGYRRPDRRPREDGK